MAIVLGPNQYGKAEVRLVHVDRSTAVHKIKDVNVTSQLIGDFSATHSRRTPRATTAPSSPPTPRRTPSTRWPACTAWARSRTSRCAWRATSSTSTSRSRAPRQAVEEYFWDRIVTAEGTPHDHSFSKGSPEVRTTVVTKDGDAETVISGLQNLTVLKSTGSEFWGFPDVEYTSLVETTDRIMATVVTSRWRYVSGDTGWDVDWDKTYASVRSIMLDKFAAVHSLSLQQTLYAMGEAVLESHPEIAEMRLSMPNKHHFLVDLSKWGLDNPNEVWYAADRPYGLIEASIIRDDLPPAPEAWLGVKGFI